MTAGFIAFELDLMKAVMDQLVPSLDTLHGAPLTPENAGALPDAQGVYLLLHEGKVQYVGKTDAEAGLRTRITRHARKFEHRRNIKPSDVMFKTAQVLVLTAMDVESRLIAHYDAEWNGSGFGSNDPGCERETTNKPEQGFDARFPIDIDLPVEALPPGDHNVHEALVALKDALPYTLRFEVVGKGGQAYRNRPHPDYVSNRVVVPPPPHTVRQLLKLIVATLPVGWQATEFVSHVILYKESRGYTHGTVI
ncbi:MAG TPA: GIY-YIG nuclease family protein [Methylocella sp.]|nr:GIY-YIG nuclease family protein [Methylocella sp.]